MLFTAVIDPKECSIQVLAVLTPSGQTVGSLFRVIYGQAKHNAPTTEANIAKFDLLYQLASALLEALRALRGGYAMHRAGMLYPYEGGNQLLGGLTPSGQTVGSLFRVIHDQEKHSS
jgi:hypothetical protein